MNGEPHPVVRAIKPVLDAVGATLVPPAQQEPSDVPLVWNGDVIAAVRMPPLHGALDRLIDTVEAELGGPLPSLSRETSARRPAARREGRVHPAPRRRGRRRRDGRSRITVYNYLNAIHR